MAGSDDRIEAYADAMFEVARAEGTMDEVEDELFRFARIVEGNDDLRMTLANPGLPLDRRAGIVDELLENRALPITRAITTFLVGAGRAEGVVLAEGRAGARGGLRRFVGGGDTEEFHRHGCALFPWTATPGRSRCSRQVITVRSGALSAPS